MEEKVEKISFFKKVWYSITKFEQYPTMATEGLKSAIKYLIILTAIISVFMMCCSLYEMKKSLLESANYIQEKFPEFTYSNGILSVNSEDSIIIEEPDDTGIDKIIIDTKVQTDEEKEKNKTENSVNGINAFLFNDQVILKVQNNGTETLEQVYGYQELISVFAGADTQEFTKNEFVQYLENGNMATFYGTYALAAFANYFIENFVVAIVYSLEIALLGWITTIVLRVKMRFKALFNMATYSITLSTILMTIYMVINYFTGFVIKEFQIAYIAVAYIYLATAIFILKDDFIKKMQEVEKIKQEQLKVREEIKEEQNKEENKKEDNKEEQDDKKEKDNSNGDEPQGSEV